jgi:hypothetical protein
MIYFISLITVLTSSKNRDDYIDGYIIILAKKRKITVTKKTKKKDTVPNTRRKRPPSQKQKERKKKQKKTQSVPCAIPLQRAAPALRISCSSAR